ncbi:TetR/AcrR family transcriptional regulator C-terminal domain-containing protein [Nonomuraea sp. 3-1Str]|uniref:TetR/AcrR family transcriptional regulator C-terminal domain-containing protein n=1 Tax=Nonomuraea sp. 3-1Str TaxID=2929801 RepID=UPI0028636993|nr:TetR/AcrR family transcriptional regulator C-terminal domain-containing protein [Nonomuraea sp. 3-1Str]MDR8412460.1 TetR/AcrR family transcriptional regulator C-terminal domain-containing protein [Nonomuraea sp. 3-1Str]
METVSAYSTGAIRRESANLRAERATGLSKRDWQRAHGPHVERMLATGRFPALAKAVHDGTEVDAEETFATGLDWVLDAVAAKTRPAAGVTLRISSVAPASVVSSGFRCPCNLCRSGPSRSTPPRRRRTRAPE